MLVLQHFPRSRGPRISTCSRRCHQSSTRDSREPMIRTQRRLDQAHRSCRADHRDGQCRGWHLRRRAGRVRVHELKTRSGNVLVFTVSLGDRVQKNTEGDTFQRIGDESRRLPFSQRQELQWGQRHCNFRGHASTCCWNTPSQPATLRDLRTLRDAEYIRWENESPNLAHRVIRLAADQLIV